MTFYRKTTDVLGGVLFKYRLGRYGRSVTQNLLCMQQCDAVVCTGEGIGITTLIEKVKDFKTIIGDFPVSV